MPIINMPLDLLLRLVNRERAVIDESRIVQTLDAFGSLLVGLVGLLLAWRTAAGAITVQQSGETSMILGIPQWISQALMVPGFALLGMVGLYMTVHCWNLRNSPTTEIKP